MSDLSLSGLSALYSNTDYSSISSDKLSSRISDADYSEASDDELMDACKEFETYFVEQVLKEAEKMISTDDDDEDSYASSIKDYSTDGLIEQYAQMISDQGSLGLADTLYEQMKRNYNV